MADNAYEGFTDSRIKHLEMIQVVVARLASEAALIRGWALTVSAAFFAYSAESSSWPVAVVGLLPVAAFWGLNAYYLRAERKYRKLFDRVRMEDSTVSPFSMDARHEEVGWASTFLSTTLWPFYGALFAVGVTLVVVGLCGGRDENIQSESAKRFPPFAAYPAVLWEAR